jgi:DNA polymerase-3 subunit delta'
MAKLVFHNETQTSIDRVIAERPQSLLIVGPKGSGKDATVDYIIQKLLNVEAITTALPIHKVGDDADNSISIESIRQAQHYLSRKDDRDSKGRIVLIAGSERLGIEAQNALLKTLEEPPQASFIILMVNSSSVLLPTILSRVQSVEIKQPSPDELMKYFIGVGHSESSIKRAALMSGGLPGLMQGILSSDSEHPLLKAAASARDILRLDTFGRLAMVDGLSKQREYFMDVLFMLIQMSRVTLRDTTKPASTLLHWQNVLREGVKAQRALKSQAQPKLVATNLMLSLYASSGQFDILS